MNTPDAEKYLATLFIREMELKASEILRLAAERIANRHNTYGCIAIDYASDYCTDSRFETLLSARAYFAMLKPKGNRSGYWFGQAPTEETQNQRVIALCLAAAIAESEGA